LSFDDVIKSDVRNVFMDSVTGFVKSALYRFKIDGAEVPILVIFDQLGDLKDSTRSQRKEGTFKIISIDSNPPQATQDFITRPRAFDEIDFNGERWIVEGSTDGDDGYMWNVFCYTDARANIG
jgi:hypothetical protein